MTGGKLTTYRKMAEDTVDVAVAGLGERRRRRRCAPGASACRAPTAAGTAAPPSRWPASPMRRGRLHRRYGTEARRPGAGRGAPRAAASPSWRGCPTSAPRSLRRAPRDGRHARRRACRGAPGRSSSDARATVGAASAVAALIGPRPGLGRRRAAPRPRPRACAPDCWPDRPGSRAGLDAGTGEPEPPTPVTPGRRREAPPRHRCASARRCVDSPASLLDRLPAHGRRRCLGSTTRPGPRRAATGGRWPSAGRPQGAVPPAAGGGGAAQLDRGGVRRAGRLQCGRGAGHPGRRPQRGVRRHRCRCSAGSRST